ncbi:MAG: dihydrofolate reductase [Oscillospiraceae bacterium]|nr:dihydrofolate reductase [Oscillospiraceae bacterium]
MKAIVAVDSCWGIGCNNQLLFSIPEDMRYFREFTMGKTVVMGRSTLESLPGSKPLKNRVNVILSRNPSFRVESAKVCNSLEQLLECVSAYEQNDVIVIGGQTVYEQLLNYCSAVHVTKVEGFNGKADCFFPNLDELPNWSVESESEVKSHDGLTYAFYVYSNNNPLLY